MTDQLDFLYAEPHRHYHTMQHILECMAWLVRVEHLAENFSLLGQAILYHDAVYDSMANDNEEQSAALVDDLEVKRLILLTKHDTRVQDIDGQLMCDIDLAILGASPYRFTEYCAQIRREYEGVADDVFIPARIAVLGGFLNRPTIYRTAFFTNRLGQMAEGNLEAEVKRLTG